MLAGVKLFYRQLLNVALIEGSAEFLASVITGESFLDKDNIAYGEANETMLWQKFKEDIKTNKSDHWLYNGAKNKEERGGLPVDMGYWVGFRIAKAIGATWPISSKPSAIFCSGKMPMSSCKSLVTMPCILKTSNQSNH